MDNKAKSEALKGKKPKGRMSNYTFFVQMCREEHRKKHPNENVNFTEFSKKCAERWKVIILFLHDKYIFILILILTIEANDRQRKKTIR